MAIKKHQYRLQKREEEAGNTEVVENIIIINKNNINNNSGNTEVVDRIIIINNININNNSGDTEVVELQESNVKLRTFLLDLAKRRPWQAAALRKGASTLIRMEE